MDANLDPSITGQDIFHASTLDRSNDIHNDLDRHHDHVHHHEDEDDHANVFRLNEYVAEHSHADESTATAALIQFNSMVSGDSGTSVIGGGSSGVSGGSGVDTAANYYIQSETYAEEISPPAEKPTSIVKLVEYDPSGKPKRLGRPRKNITNSLAPPENSSSKNLNGAILSKFRLDSQPLEGPGSRGGRQGGRKSPRGRVTSSTMRKRKQQQLNFVVDKEKTAVYTKLKDEETPQVISEMSSEPQGTPDVRSDYDAEGSVELLEDATGNLVTESPKSLPEKTKKPKETKKSEKKRTATKSERNKKEGSKPETGKQVESLLETLKRKIKHSQTASKRLKNSRLVSVSRTTVLNSVNRLSRQLPGPLIGLHYDLYDENILNAPQNIIATSEKIALGFPVKESPYASDILTIVAFLMKFQKVTDIYGIGPKNIEEGLSLPIFALGKESEENGNEEQGLNEEKVEESFQSDRKYDPKYVSDEMNQLFYRLLTLVLNRKKPIHSHGKAIAELKTMSVVLGLPKEWKEQPIPSAEKTAIEEVTFSPVDPSKEILLSKIPETIEPKVKYNPFYSTEFERYGLEGLENPVDRLILLRTLLQWSLTSSDLMKNYISQNLQAQDIPGDKDSQYAAVSILKGFKYTEALKKEAEIKLSKRKSEEGVKYVDPTSNPLNHCLELRLNEHLVGDLGFHAGRFFLCRMWGEDNGGLSSIKKMKTTWSTSASLRVELPSNFKLYVQDVYSMLVGALTNDGIEFDEDGKEVESLTVQPGSTWYEVASNSEELANFVDYLASRLGINSDVSAPTVIPMTSMIYKPALNLHDYLSSVLPLVSEQEHLQVTAAKSEKRSSRLKSINYSDAKASEEYLAMLEEEGVIEHHEEAGDDDYEDDEVLEVQDDDEEEYED